MINEFDRTNKVNRPTARVQDSLQKTMREFTNRPENDNYQMMNIPLAAWVENNIEHKLGKDPQGWIITRVNAATVIWEVTAGTDKINLCLSCTVPCTVNIKVW